MINKIIGLLAAACVCTGTVAAAELPAGTIITASNLDAVLGDSFDGHALADVMPESMRLMIRKYALQLKLKKINKLPVDESYYRVTEKYSGQVEIDPTTKLLKNYVAGTPFPTVDLVDPLGG